MDGSTTTVEFKYHEPDPAPITLRYLVKRDVAPTSRTDVDYLLDVSFSGPDLAAATSVFKRIAVDGQGKPSSDEMFDTQAQRSAYSPIKLQRPKQFDEFIRLVIVNASKIDLKPEDLHYGPGYISSGTDHAIGLKYTYPDFSLKFDPRKEPQGGELLVNLDFAKPPGIEASSGSEPQRSRIRLNPDKAKSLHVRLVKLLNPGDDPLQIEGSRNPISATDRPVYVCQIAYRSGS